MKKKFTVAALCVGAIALGIGAYYGYAFWQYKSGVEQLKAQDFAVDLARIPDGEYFGDCDVGFVAARVRVDVADGRIVAVELLEHYNDRGAPAEVIPQRIVEAQRINVDAVTGATNSSKVIQEAVHNALTGRRRVWQGSRWGKPTE